MWLTSTCIPESFQAKSLYLEPLVSYHLLPMRPQPLLELNFEIFFA